MLTFSAELAEIDRCERLVRLNRVMEPLYFEGPDTTCGTCFKKTIEDPKNSGTRGRCWFCNALKWRMQRVFAKNEDLQKSWVELSPSARTCFHKFRAWDMGVKDLGKAMALHIEKSLHFEKEAGQCRGIDPEKRRCDSPELARRYKGRDTELNSVKRRVPKVWDSRRQCFLDEDHDDGGENTIKKGERIKTQRCPVTPVVSPCKFKPYPPRSRDPKYDRKPFDRLKVKLDKAREEADAAIVGYEAEDVPNGVRQIAILNDELERMKIEIDFFADGDHSSLFTADVQRKTMELLMRHKKTLKSFLRVHKSTRKASEF